MPQEQDPADAVDAVLAQWQRERPDLDTTPMALVGRLARAARLVETAQRATFAAHDLDPASFDVLATLRRAGAPHQLTPGDLTRSAMVTSGAITQRLDRLQARGLVTRARADHDARAVTVTLTEAGRALLDAALPDHLATEEHLLTGLTEDDRAQLTALLRRLLLTLETHGPARATTSADDHRPQPHQR